jgi:hypothetical protein
MPLHIPATDEHPEVAALKAQVRKVANKYAKRHSWCSVVKDALREMGIDPDEPKITVDIDFQIAGTEVQTAVRKFLVSDLAGKTTAEQNTLAAEQISPIVNVSGVAVTIPVTVLDMNLHTASASGPVVDVPDGYSAFFSSAEGRVKHLVRTVDVERQYTRATRFVCGTYTYDRTATSLRSENRICAKCASRA